MCLSATRLVCRCDLVCRFNVGLVVEKTLGDVELIHLDCNPERCQPLLWAQFDDREYRTQSHPTGFMASVLAPKSRRQLTTFKCLVAVATISAVQPNYPVMS